MNLCGGVLPEPGFHITLNVRKLGDPRYEIVYFDTSAEK